MTRRLRRLASSVVAVALVVSGLSGCSSDAPPQPPQPGTVSAGTANTSIDGSEASTHDDVSCESHGTVTTVKTGNEDAGFTAVVSSDPGLLVESVSILNLSGFTGSYNNGLGDPAQVTMTGRTYQLSGVADGFDTNSPSFRKSGKFSIQVSC